MEFHLPTADGRRRAIRRIAPLAVPLLGAAAFAGPAFGAGVPAPAVGPLGPTGDPTLEVIGDSVIVIGPPLGRVTVQVTRPDAITQQPVVIGQYSGFAGPYGPLTVNTSTPTALASSGDCWGSGAITTPSGKGLTPDIRPGDTVSVTGGFAGFPGGGLIGVPGLPGPGAAPLGGAPAPTTVTVGTDSLGDLAPHGPVGVCAPNSDFAENAVTDGPKSLSGGDLVVSGVAQPGATGVSVSATDGTHSTAATDVTPADGKWTATIPASAVQALATGPLTVNAVFAVPDLATGAPAHIAGTPLTIQKVAASDPVQSPNAAPPGRAPGAAPGRGPATPGDQTPASGPGAGPGPVAAPGAGRGGLMRVRQVRTTRRISLRQARGTGITASFLVPRGARVIQVQLSRGRRVVLRRLVPAAAPGSRQTVRLGGVRLRHGLRVGRYGLALRAGASPTLLKTAVTSPISLG